MIRIQILTAVLLVTQGPRYEIDRIAYDNFIYKQFGEIFSLAATEISKEINLMQEDVLEIGFTAPHISIELAKITSAHFYVLAVDTIEARICSMRIEESNLIDRFTIRIGTIESLPFDDTAFVLVIAREAMRFWQTNENAYRGINRVLKSKGIALLGAGFGTAITDEKAQALWGTVQQWRLTTGCEPWQATRPVPDEIERALLAAGIYDYSLTVEGECTCRTVIRWQKTPRPR